jgi:transposase
MGSVVFGQIGYGKILRPSSFFVNAEPILNYFDNGTTNGFAEGCNTKTKMPERVSYGLRSVDVYWRKMLLGFVPSRSYFHTI